MLVVCVCMCEGGRVSLVSLLVKTNYCNIHHPQLAFNLSCFFLPHQTSVNNYRKLLKAIKNSKIKILLSRIRSNFLRGEIELVEYFCSFCDCSAFALCFASFCFALLWFALRCYWLSGVGVLTWVVY